MSETYIDTASRFRQLPDDSPPEEQTTLPTDVVLQNLLDILNYDSDDSTPEEQPHLSGEEGLQDIQGLMNPTFEDLLIANRVLDVIDYLLEKPGDVKSICGDTSEPGEQYLPINFISSPEMFMVLAYFGLEITENLISKIYEASFTKLQNSSERLDVLRYIAYKHGIDITEYGEDMDNISNHILLAMQERGLVGQPLDFENQEEDAFYIHNYLINDAPDESDHDESDLVGVSADNVHE